MPGLNLIVLSDDAERLRGALVLALTQMALGAQVPRDADHAAHGLPGLAALIEEALDAGVSVIACQSGLALAGLDVSVLDPRITVGGPLSFMQALGADGQLVTI